ncbi:MAG: hypothetical protein ACTSX9_01890 [Candidatus Njordarchaeales archaeon]
MTAYNAVIVEIYPDDTDTDLERVLKDLKESLPDDIEIKDHKIEPLAFGINKLIIAFLVPEKEEKIRQLEEILNSIEGASAEIKSISRI